MWGSWFIKTNILRPVSIVCKDNYRFYFFWKWKHIIIKIKCRKNLVVDITIWLEVPPLLHRPPYIQLHFLRMFCPVLFCFRSNSWIPRCWVWAKGKGVWGIPPHFSICWCSRRTLNLFTCTGIGTTILGLLDGPLRFPPLLDDAAIPPAFTRFHLALLFWNQIFTWNKWTSNITIKCVRGRRSQGGKRKPTPPINMMRWRLPNRYKFYNSFESYAILHNKYKRKNVWQS